jgi:hypothetical protein
MSVKLIIGQQVINFPTSGTDSNYAPAIVQFAQAVTDQLSSIASSFDISPRVQVLTDDVNSAIDVVGCSFPSSSVRAFTFNYAIYRTNDVDSYAENGVVGAVYDTLTSTWILQHEFEGQRQSDGSLYNSFSMSGDQLTLTTVGIGGTYNSVTSKISYNARTNLVSDT